MLFEWVPRCAHTRETVEVSCVVGLAPGDPARPFRAVWFDAFRVRLLFIEIALRLFVAESHPYAACELRRGCPSFSGGLPGHRGMFGATLAAFVSAGCGDNSGLEVAEAVGAVEAAGLRQFREHCA